MHEVVLLHLENIGESMMINFLAIQAIGVKIVNS